MKVSTIYISGMLAMGFTVITTLLISLGHVEESKVFALLTCAMAIQCNADKRK